MGLRVPPPPWASIEEVERWVEEGRRTRRNSIIAGFVIGFIILLVEFW